MKKQKDYKIAYNNALKWMSGLYPGLHGKTKEEAELYFPELKNLESEKIKKELIDFCKDNNFKKWTEWLNNLKTPEESLEISSETYNDIVNACLFGDDNTDNADNNVKITTKNDDHDYDKEIKNALLNYI